MITSEMYVQSYSNKISFISKVALICITLLSYTMCKLALNRIWFCNFSAPDLASVLSLQGGPELSGDTVNSQSSTAASATTIGTIVAVVLAVFNLLVLTVLGVRYLRSRSQNQSASSDTAGLTNSGFRSEAGTIRSFNSLASKFGPSSEGDDLSVASTISS